MIKILSTIKKMANSHKGFLFICFWTVKWLSTAPCPAGEVCIGEGGGECTVTDLYILTGNILLSAQGKFEWVIFQCYLSWMYDRFCTLDKEQSNNNGNPGKKKVTYFNILLSLPETIFHRMWQNFTLILSIWLLAALFPLK